MNKWEEAFKNNNKMWGEESEEITFKALEIFNRHNVSDVLVAGFGYGRNVKVFAENNLNVDGIEISQSAVKLSKRELYNNIYIGSVANSDFFRNSYDAIFCHGLIYLLGKNERKDFINNCFNCLNEGGLLFLTTLKKDDKILKDSTKVDEYNYLNKANMNLFFYNEDSFSKDFVNFNMISKEEFNSTFAFYSLLLQRQ